MHCTVCHDRTRTRSFPTHLPRTFCTARRAFAFYVCYTPLPHTFDVAPLTFSVRSHITFPRYHAGWVCGLFAFYLAFFPHRCRCRVPVAFTHSRSGLVGFLRRTCCVYVLPTVVQLPLHTHTLTHTFAATARCRSLRCRWFCRFTCRLHVLCYYAPPPSRLRAVRCVLLPLVLPVVPTFTTPVYTRHCRLCNVYNTATTHSPHGYVTHAVCCTILGLPTRIAVHTRSPHIARVVYFAVLLPG